MIIIMMQEKFSNENNRSLNYTKIDQCQDNNCIDNDEYYRQILHLNEHFNIEQDIKIILTNRFRLILFIFFILTSQSNALPIYQSLQTQSKYFRSRFFGINFCLVNYNQQSPSSLPVAMVQLTDRSHPQQSFKVYRRFPNPIQQQLNNIPSYSNGAVVQIYDQTNINNQQQSSPIVQNPNQQQQQFTLQVRRERQRRAMIEKIVTMFDEDGWLLFFFLFRFILFLFYR